QGRVTLGHHGGHWSPYQKCIGRPLHPRACGLFFPIKELLWPRTSASSSPVCASRTRSCSRRHRRPNRTTTSSAPLRRAVGGVVTKTIGLHPVVNVAGARTTFNRADAAGHVSMRKRLGTVLHSSWNWELISDKPLDWWAPRLGKIKRAFPDKILVCSIMAGAG